MSEENQRLKYRLMGFTVSVVLLGLLGVPWLRFMSQQSITDSFADFTTGVGLLKDTGDNASILVVAYLAMALLILVRTTMGTAFWGGIVGLLATLLIVSTDDGWTGAPVMAIGLWMVTILIGALTWKDSR